VSYAAGTVEDLEARGTALKAKGDAAGALAVYQQAAALDPKSARLADEVGFLLAVLNRRDEAIQSFQRAIELDPKFAPAQYHLGAAYWLAKDTARSIPHLQSAAALEPGNFAYQYKFGEALKSQGDYAGALPHLRAAVALDAGHADAWNTLGMALQQTGDLSEVVIVHGFHKVLEGRNGEGNPWHTDGDLYEGVIKPVHPQSNPQPKESKP